MSVNNVIEHEDIARERAPEINIEVPYARKEKKKDNRKTLKDAGEVPGA